MALGEVGGSFVRPGGAGRAGEAFSRRACVWIRVGILRVLHDYKTRQLTGVTRLH